MCLREIKTHKKVILWGKKIPIDRYIKAIYVEEKPRLPVGNCKMILVQAGIGIAL